MHLRALLLCLPFLLPLPSCGQEKPALPAGFKALKNQDYVGANNPRQMLDLYLPEAPAAKPRPLVVYIHGGGWAAGSKDSAEALLGLIRDGTYVGASLNYRLTNEAGWPAQIHDCKAAIRWLRAHAQDYQYDPDKIAVFGISAGGHLVSMLGVSGGVAELEGSLGSHTAQSSRVTCVLDFCGPSSFLTFGGHGSIVNENDPNGILAKLIGGPLKDQTEAARKASPISYLTKDDAPFLIIHGDKDNIVPFTQATEFDAALRQAGLSSTLITGTNAGHVFFSFPLFQQMRDFIDHHLLGKDVQIPGGAVPGQ